MASGPDRLPPIMVRRGPGQAEAPGLDKLVHIVSIYTPVITQSIINYPPSCKYFPTSGGDLIQ